MVSLYFLPFCSSGHIQAESGWPSAKDWCWMEADFYLGVQDSIFHLAECSESYEVLTESIISKYSGENMRIKKLENVNNTKCYCAKCFIYTILISAHNLAHYYTFLSLFILRARAHEWGRGRERGERESQAGSAMSVQRLTQGSISQTMRS